MKKYYESFHLVELNSTFYHYPRISTVAGWRDNAPADFEFTVKAHQDISHRFRFAVEPSLKPFEQMKEICKILEAQVLLIQTHGSFGPNKLGDAYNFFRKIPRDDLECMHAIPIKPITLVSEQLKPEQRGFGISLILSNAFPVFTL